MKPLAMFACAGALCAALFSEEPAQAWDAAFLASFSVAAGTESVAVDPSSWLEQNREVIAETRSSGLDPYRAGALAAELMLQWDWDVRTGLSIQEADARLRQSVRVAAFGGPSGTRRLSSMRKAAGPSGDGAISRGKALAGGKFPDAARAGRAGRR